MEARCGQFKLKRRFKPKICSLYFIIAFIALFSIHLETSCLASVLFNPRNLTEYTIRIPALKKPTIFKRFSSSEKHSKKGSNKSGSSKASMSSRPSATVMRPSMNIPPMAVLPLSSTLMKGQKGNYPFHQLPFTAIPGRGPMPTFKYSGPPIWARDPAAFSRGQFTAGGPSSLSHPLMGLSPTRATQEHSKTLPYLTEAGKISSSKLPQLESQNNMRVVVLRPPYNTLDHSAIHVDEKGLADSHRQFAAGSHNKVLEYYTGNRHKNPLSSAASLNDVSEIQIINIPPRRSSERRRLFGSQRHTMTKPTIVKLPSNQIRGFQAKFPPTLMLENTPKQFIAEEKTLGDGRNTYIISEVDGNQPDILNKIRPSFSAPSPSNSNNNQYFNTESNNGPPDDWNLSLPATKKNSAFSHLNGNLKSFNNLKNIITMENSGFSGASSGNIGHSGPNFGSDYGSLLELQSAKQRLANLKHVHNIDHYSNHHFSRTNNGYGSNRFESSNNNNNNNNNDNINSFSSNKHPLVIAVGSMAKDSWDGPKDSSQWLTTRTDSRRSSSMTTSGHGRANIQVLRTDKDSKVIVPPGMIAILVPQSFGVTATTGSVTSSGSIDFDDDGQPFFESSSTTKKTVVPSPGSLPDSSVNNDERIEPSKSPGPPYKVDFTRGLPPNAIAKPDFNVQIQNRIGVKEDPSSDTSSSASEEVSIQKTSIPTVLAASSQKQSSRRSQSKQQQQQNSDRSTEGGLDLALYVNNFQQNIPSARSGPRPLSQLQPTMPPKLRGTSQTTPMTPSQLDPVEEFSHHTIERPLPPSSVRKTRTTTPPTWRQYGHVYKHKTTQTIPRNHRAQPFPSSFPPAAFDSESAGFYLPRASALKRNSQDRKINDGVGLDHQRGSSYSFHHYEHVNGDRRVGRSYKARKF